MAVTLAKVVNQDSSGRIKLLINDLDGDPILAADVSSAIMVLRDKNTNTIIQRDLADSRDVASQFVDGQTLYNFTYLCNNLDSAIMTSNNKIRHEWRVMHLDLKVDSGGGTTLYYTEEYLFKILKHKV